MFYAVTIGTHGARTGCRMNSERAMTQYEFKVVALDRSELRQSGSAASNELDGLGAERWHIVHVKEDPQHGRDLLIFLEREKPA